jgi:hypothetical protein
MEQAPFFSGVIAMGFAVVSVFFLRFWRRTRDLLFLVFSIAFTLLALNQALSTLLGLPLEERSWLYSLRLVAFLIIIAAIIWKNVRR